MSIVEPQLAAHPPEDSDSEQSRRELTEALRTQADTTAPKAPPSLDALASNINPSYEGRSPKVDTYWPNIAHTHSGQEQTLAEDNYRRNHRLQEIVDRTVADFRPGSAETLAAIRNTNEWYRSLGPLNSLHNQGQRLERASDIMYNATMAFKGAPSLDKLLQQPKSEEAIEDILTCLDMKVDASRDPAKHLMYSERATLHQDVMSKAFAIMRGLEARLQAPGLEQKEKEALASQLNRALRIHYGAIVDLTQLAAHVSIEIAQKSPDQDTKPRLSPTLEQKIKNITGKEDLEFEEQYDILLHEQMFLLAAKTLELSKKGLVSNGDLFEAVSYIIAARQFCTSINYDVGEYQVHFATWRQDSPADGRFTDGKQSYDISLVHTNLTPEEPTWRLPIQAKAIGSTGAQKTAEKYDGRILLFNLFEDITPEPGSQNPEGNENYQIALRLQRLLRAIIDAEEQALHVYDDKEWPSRALPEDKKLLVSASSQLRDQVKRRFQADAEQLS